MAQRANRLLDLAMDLATIDEKIALLRREYSDKAAEMAELLKNPGAPLDVIDEKRAAPQVESSAVDKTGRRDKKKPRGSKRFSADGRHPDPKPMRGMGRRQRKILDLFFETPDDSVSVHHIYDRLGASNDSQKGAIRAELNRLHRGDYIRWVQKGVYRLPKRNTTGAIHNGSATHEVMTAMRGDPHRVWSIQDLQDSLGYDGREQIYKATRALQKHGLVTRMGRGEYRLITE